MGKRELGKTFMASLIAGSLVLANRSDIYASNLPSVNTTREEQNYTQIVNEPIECTIYYDDGNKETLQGNPKKSDIIQQAIDKAREKGSSKVDIKLPTEFHMIQGVDFTGIDLTIYGIPNQKSTVYKDYEYKTDVNAPFHTTNSQGKKSKITLQNIRFIDCYDNQFAGVYGDENGGKLNVSLENIEATHFDTYNCTDVKIVDSTINNSYNVLCSNVIYNNSKIDFINAITSSSLELNNVNIKSDVFVSDADSVYINNSNIIYINMRNIQSSYISRSYIKSFDITSSMVMFENCYFPSTERSYIIYEDVDLIFLSCKTHDHARVYAGMGIAEASIPITPFGEIITDGEVNILKATMVSQEEEKVPIDENTEFTYCSHKKRYDAFRMSQVPNSLKFDNAIKINNQKFNPNYTPSAPKHTSSKTTSER